MEINFTEIQKVAIIGILEKNIKWNKEEHSILLRKQSTNKLKVINFCFELCNVEIYKMKTKPK